MIVKHLITGDPIEINVRQNADRYEIMQETVRESAIRWKETKSNDKAAIKTFEKYALRFGLQKELKALDII